MFGIPAHATFCAEVLLQQGNETCEDDICATLFLGRALFDTVDDARHIVEHRQQQRLYQFCAVVVILVSHFLTDVLEIVAVGLYLLIGEVYYGVVHREQQERRDILDVLYETMIELRAQHDAQTLEVTRCHVVIYDVAL